MTHVDLNVSDNPDQIRVGVDDEKNVRVMFATPTLWFSMEPAQALDFARTISEKATDALMRRSRTNN